MARRFAALLRLICLLGLVAGASGCATTVIPAYAPSVGNADAAGKLAGSVAVGKFGFEKGREAELNSVGARASTFSSPTNGSYADYFADAAQKELRQGGKFDATAPRVLTGVLLVNHLNAGGTQANESSLRVRFRLALGDSALYEKTVEARNTWESSFMGAIAIPLAMSNYIATIQKLYGNLFSDPEFLRATGSK